MPISVTNKHYTKDKRSRNFSLISYLDEIQIKFVLCEHANHIKSCAYIYHDKDMKEDGTLKEPHYHILLCLYNARYESSIKNWFMRFENSDGDLINTHTQVCRDISNTYRYLTHSTENSKDKYRYSKDDIKGVNLDFFKDLDEQDKDNALCALEDLLNGISYRVLFQRYGRDVIYHISQLQQAYLMVRMEEQGKTIDDMYEDKII